MDMRRWAKGGFGLVVVVVIFVVVVNWIGDYRTAQRPLSKANSETTTTAAPGSGVQTPQNVPTQPQAAAQVLVVQVEGLNLRQKPSGTSRAYRGLAKGEKVVLIAQEGDWYKVRDSAGTVGYVTSNPAYTKKTSE